MNRATAILICISALGGQPPAGEFTFVESQRTGKHIAVQPKPDHHRVYFPVRIRECAGEKVFGRVRCVVPANGSNEYESMVTQIVSIEDNNELWAMYFRLPRFGRKTTVYQIELGVYTPRKVEQFRPRQTFAWKVTRDEEGEVEFVHELDNGRAVFLPIKIRTAQIRGGKIEIQYAKAVPAPPRVALEYGFTYNGANVAVDGESMARRYE